MTYGSHSPIHIHELVLSRSAETLGLHITITTPSEVNSHTFLLAIAQLAVTLSH